MLKQKLQESMASVTDVFSDFNIVYDKLCKNYLTKSLTNRICLCHYICSQSPVFGNRMRGFYVILLKTKTNMIMKYECFF